MTIGLKEVALASALALSPLAASAATVLADGDSVDLLADSYFFNGDFAIGDSAGTLTFTFTNSSASAAAVTLFGATVLQASAAFDDGVTFEFGDMVPASVAEGSTTGFANQFIVAAGDTVDLVISYGAVIDTGLIPSGLADIDFVVEAAIVPLPAAGLLLLTAMGGLALARRRKADAA